MDQLLTYAQWLTALVIWREARGEPTEGKVAVAWVIHNRANDKQGRWPKSIVDIILQPSQFSAFNSTDPNASKLPKGNDAIFSACCDIAISPGVSDPTLGANSYHAYPDGDLRVPKWATPDKFTVKIGNHRFYKL